jgi:hypothetical protein
VAEISNRAVATAAAGAMLAVGLAFVGNADASHQYDDEVRCRGKLIRSVQLVAGNRQSAVFRKLKPSPGNGSVSVAYGCLRSGGTITRLGLANRVDGPKFAGRYVGFRNTIYVNESGSASGIRVVDLHSGATTVSEPGEPGSDGDSHLAMFVLKRNGSVAWIGLPQSFDRGSVWRVDRAAAEPQRLDGGPDIDFESLRLSADRRSLRWSNDGQERTAAID